MTIPLQTGTYTSGLLRRSNVDKSDRAFYLFQSTHPRKGFCPSGLTNCRTAMNGSEHNDFNEKDDLITRSKWHESHDAEIMAYEKDDLFISDDCLSDKRQHYLDPSGSAPVDKVEDGEEREMNEDNESVWVVQPRENYLFAPHGSTRRCPGPVIRALCATRRWASCLIPLYEQI